MDCLIIAERAVSRRIVLGLSGGIDSALAACIATAAVGSENVTGISMPSKHSSQHSIDDAKATAEALGINFSIQPITDLHQATDSSLSDILEGGHPVAGENLASKITRSYRDGACKCAWSDGYCNWE